ncbi:MAG: squalene/phytoene synthase family protein [Candidatus Woesearchaeota archaeon]
MKNVNRFLDQLLEQVSRSFAKAIPIIDQNKRTIVSTMYLLCRTLDTIEDSKLRDTQKQELCKRFVYNLSSGCLLTEKNITETVTPTIIDEHDKIIFKDNNLSKLNYIFQSFDQDTKKISLESINKMQEGMIKFLSRKKNYNNVNYYCETFLDLDNYCYSVAGTVGEFLTDLVRIKDHIRLDREKALIFGRYLQKVNIIKDFSKDFSEGRCYWPFYFDLKNKIVEKNKPENNINSLCLEQMICSALNEFIPTFEYLLSIPNKIKGYRAFCRMSALMATETLKKLKNNTDVFDPKKEIKILKKQFINIYWTSRLHLYSLKEIEKYAEKNYAILIA